MTATTVFVPASPSGLRSAPRTAVPVRRPITPARVRSRVVTGGPSCVAPQPVAASSAVQLTRRGWTVLIGIATAVAAVLVWVAYLSHPAAAPAAAPAPAQVVVQSGDTLWSIAERVAPGEDPRAVVWDLQQTNHLADPVVVPGQVLHVG